MTIPSDLRYSPDHEWARREGTGIRIGITDFAQEALGDIVFVSLPEVGATLAADDQIGEVESTKSVSEIYAPIAGTVVEVNAPVVEDPSLLNSDPYGAGWICLIAPSDPDAYDALLDPDAYGELTVS